MNNFGSIKNLASSIEKVRGKRRLNPREQKIAMREGANESETESPEHEKSESPTFERFEMRGRRRKMKGFALP
jgi:hypothetical protein